ncbi:hypothetical protein EDD18DRAFT_1334639, partial [Armillaria luteobubalina]
MAKDCVASGSGTSGAVMKMDDTLSPPLSAVDVAALGRLGTSRSLAMSEIPSNVQEKDVQEILSQHGDLESWIFDSPKRTATARYFDMHDAFQALVDLRSNGINTLPLTNPDGYIFPTWFPAEEADKGMVNCRVKFSGITDPKMILHLRSWIVDFEKDHVPVLSISMSREQGTAMLQFASSDLAQKFCNTCASRALELGVEVSVARRQSPIRRGLVTALALGVCRTVTINLTSEKDLTNSNDYLHFFKRIGVITPESKVQFTSPVRELRISYEKLSSAMRCILVLADLEVAGSKHSTLPDFEGASMNFLGARLNPSPISPILASYSQLAQIDRDSGPQSGRRTGLVEQDLTTNGLDMLGNRIPAKRDRILGRYLEDVLAKRSLSNPEYAQCGDRYWYWGSSTMTGETISEAILTSPPSLLPEATSKSLVADPQSSSEDSDDTSGDSETTPYVFRRHRWPPKHITFPKVVISAVTEIGQAESSVRIPLQRRYTRRRPVIPSSLADTPCVTLGVRGVLDRLNETLRTSYTLDILSLRSILENCIEKDYDFGTAYGRLRQIWYIDDWSNIPDDLRRWEENDGERRRKALVGNRIVEPSLPPRRVWDLYSNRVVPWWTVDISDTVQLPRLPISHAWVDEKDRDDLWTPINGKEWPYMWLDVLCLRQKGGLREDLRMTEWRLDVPTIGYVYEGVTVVIYLSGLGVPVSVKKGDLDSDRCWFRRAWTLQEVGDKRIIAGMTSDGPMHEKPTDEDGNYKTEMLTRFHKQLLGLGRNDWDLFNRLADMRNRVSTNPVDKVAGLAFPLGPGTIPTYHETESLEDAWTALVNSMYGSMRESFLLLYPGIGLGQKKWRPTWEQIMTEPLPVDHLCGGFVRRDDGTDEDWFAEVCIERGHVLGLDVPFTEGRDRCGELVVESMDGEPYTFAIRATHQFLIPEDTYTLLGSSERVKHADIDRIRRQYWAVGRRLSDGRFEKVSVVVMDARKDAGRENPVMIYGAVHAVGCLGYCGNVFPFLYLASYVRPAHRSDFIYRNNGTRILAAIKSNATESVPGVARIPTCPVFNEDSPTQSRVVSEDGTSEAVLKVHDALSLHYLLPIYRSLGHWTSRRRNGISIPPTGPDRCISPKWFPAEEATQEINNYRIQSAGVGCQSICGTPSIDNLRGLVTVLALAYSRTSSEAFNGLESDTRKMRSASSDAADDVPPKMLTTQAIIGRAYTEHRRMHFIRGIPLTSNSPCRGVAAYHHHPSLKNRSKTSYRVPISDSASLGWYHAGQQDRSNATICEFQTVDLPTQSKRFEEFFRGPERHPVKRDLLELGPGKHMHQGPAYETRGRPYNGEGFDVGQLLKDMGDDLPVRVMDVEILYIGCYLGRVIEEAKQVWVWSRIAMGTGEAFFYDCVKQFVWQHEEWLRGRECLGYWTSDSRTEDVFSTQELGTRRSAQMTTTVRGFKLPSAYGVELPILRILPSRLLVMKADVHDVEPPDICRCVQRCTPLYRTFGGSRYDSRAVTCELWESTSMGEEQSEDRDDCIEKTWDVKARTGH